MGYRIRTDMIYQILQAAVRERNGAKMTEIMYGSSRSQRQLKECLTLLVDNDLLQYHSATETFNATEKGYRFLDICNGISTTMHEEQEQQLV
jgi:predicted transcriptional regulator